MTRISALIDADQINFLLSENQRHISVIRVLVFINLDLANQLS